MKKPSYVDTTLWNERHPVGSPCELTDDFGNKIMTKTTSICWLLGHGQAVVKIEGKSGGWELDRIRMV